MANNAPKLLSFVELMTLEAVESSTDDSSSQNFMGRYTSFNPGGGIGYGGHVHAQSVWAAAQTVGDGMFVHVSKFLLSLEK